MLFRSAVLLACLAVVPFLAMFSHKIPREWRVSPRTAARVPPAPADSPSPAAPADSRPSAGPAASGPPAELAAATVAADPPATVEEQLRNLGAVSIACVPLAGGTIHRCSCRVAADPSGQLQRVFQTSNPDPSVGMRNLLGQVQFWKHRLASMAAPREPRLR